MEAALSRARAQAPKWCEPPGAAAGENHSARPSALATGERSPGGDAPLTGSQRPGPCPQRETYLRTQLTSHMKTRFEYLWGRPGSCVNKHCRLRTERDSLVGAGGGLANYLVKGSLNELNGRVDACVWVIKRFVLFWFALSRLLNLEEFISDTDFGFPFSRQSGSPGLICLYGSNTWLVLRRLAQERTYAL